MPEMKINMLEVDLTNKKSKVVDVTEDCKKYIGARGLATKLMWERMPKDTDVFSPDNLLHFGIGPMTSLIGTKMVVSFKAPLTGWKGRGASSGSLGYEMLQAGYSGGILFTGKADKPCYVYVKDDDVQIRDASNLWGARKMKTEHELKEALFKETGETFALATIGPAAENLVRFANIYIDVIHSASKWGGGAVMGSKNLKAVAVKGTKGPKYADHARVWELFSAYHNHPYTKLRKYGERRWGHMTSQPTKYYAGTELIKNGLLGWDPICDYSNPHVHEQKYKMWTDGCPGCHAVCFVPYYKRDPPWGGCAGETRHDDTGGFNANLMTPKGFEDTLPMTALLEELGVDGEECGGIIAWTMELYERGIVTKEQLGGIDLTWGNVKGVLELMKKIAYRKDLGNILAEGYKYAIPAIGKGCEKYAYQVHNCAVASYDLRPEPSRALDYAANHTGARVGTGLVSQLRESATICNFAVDTTAMGEVFGDTKNPDEACASKLLKATAGWDLTVDDIKTMELRNFIFERCYALREGYLPEKDNKLPPRCWEPVTNKYGKTYVLTEEWFNKAIKEYYVTTFQLTEKGVPSKDLLKKLGLDFVIPVLEPIGVIE
jgi:aldehyde:ferredoxin oxidoreductase